MADVMSIADKLRQIVSESAGISATTVDMAQPLANNGLEDSLDEVEFVMEVEDQFGIEVPDADFSKLVLQPLQEWQQYIEARRAAGRV